MHAGCYDRRNSHACKLPTAEGQQRNLLDVAHGVAHGVQPRQDLLGLVSEGQVDGHNITLLDEILHLSKAAVQLLFLVLIQLVVIKVQHFLATKALQYHSSAVSGIQRWAASDEAATALTDSLHQSSNCNAKAAQSAAVTVVGCFC